MLNPLLATFQNQPALIAEGMEKQFEAFLNKAAAELAKVEAASDQPVMADDFWFAPDDWRSAYRPYIVKDGMLMIPVKGVLLHDFGYQFGSWATGYTYITMALRRGLADPAVRGIAFMHNSPGGHVAGNFDLADEIYAARGKKPMRAFAYESSYSASYSLASAADSIAMPRTGGVGSIGVITVHYDVSEAIAQDGIKITFIHFGKHKKDGNSYEPLPADVKERIQARINELGEVFVSTVARNRGMEEQAVRDTEALTFSANEATSNGLADSIGSLDDAIAAFAADMSNQEDETMTTQDKAATFDQAAVDAARAEGFAAGKTEGHKEGVQAEQARRNAIMESPEAKDRPLAAAAALDTNMAADATIAFLAKLPKEVAETPKVDDKASKDKATVGSEFKAAMDKSKQPEAGAPGEAPADDEQAQATGQTSRVASTLAAFKGKSSKAA